MAVYYTSVSIEVDPMAHDVYGLTQSLPHLLDAMETEHTHIGSTSSRIHLRGHDATFLNAHFLFLCDGNNFDAGDIVRQVLHEAPHKVSHPHLQVNAATTAVGPSHDSGGLADWYYNTYPDPCAFKVGVGVRDLRSGPLGGVLRDLGVLA